MKAVTHSAQIREQERSSPFFPFFTRWLSTGESGSSHSWYSSHWLKWWVSSPVYLSPAEKKAERLFSGLKYEITLSLEAGARWSSCITLVLQPVWIFSVSGCAVNSPPPSLSLPRTLAEEIMSFQVNLNSVLHFLRYMTFLSWMETLRPPLPLLSSCVSVIWFCFFSTVIPSVCRPVLLNLLALGILSSFNLLVWFYDHAPGQRGSPASQVWGQQARWSQEAGGRKWEISWNVRFSPQWCNNSMSSAPPVFVPFLSVLWLPVLTLWNKEKKSVLGKFNNCRNPL